MDYITLSNTVRNLQKIFVKPNFTFPRYIPGVTTSPSFLRDVLFALCEYGSEVFVGESNGGYGSFLAVEAFKGHGLEEICKQTGATLVNLSSLNSAIYTKQIAGKEVSVRLPRFLVEDIALTISVPVLKVHAMTTVSLSIKNLWGCCPQDLRLLEHKDLSRKLALIAELVKARYGIVDATYGLDRHGPMDGDARFLGKFIAADNLWTLDCVCAEIMGFDPDEIHHLRVMSRVRGGAADYRAVRSNTDWEGNRWGFRLQRDLMDSLSFVCFHSNLLSKIVFDSPFTRPIYAMLGRKPRKRLT